jgi:hypothetical protein
VFEDQGWNSGCESGRGVEARDRRFSGICIKDNKVPLIFLNGAGGNVASEPAGRRLLTLTLLLDAPMHCQVVGVRLGRSVFRAV